MYCSIAGGHRSTKIEDRTVSDEWYRDSVGSRWRAAGKIDSNVKPGVPFEVTSYLNYQGSRFVERNFDPNSYIVLYVYCSTARAVFGFGSTLWIAMLRSAAMLSELHSLLECRVSAERT